MGRVLLLTGKGAAAGCGVGLLFCVAGVVISPSAAVWGFFSVWVGLTFIAVGIWRAGGHAGNARRYFLFALLLVIVWQIFWPSTEDSSLSRVLAAVPLMFSYVLDYLHEKFGDGAAVPEPRPRKDPGHIKTI